jgi:hypothetical protein
MPITIQEIIASDTISQLVDKTNFNFDQLLLNGGGPGGPAGPIGPVGPAGGRGPKGTRWYEDISTTAPGNTPIAVPPTTTPLVGDYYLQFNGQVWEYTGLTWAITTIDLQGPVGPQGAGGGMGDTFGSPVIGGQTAIYNGPIGLGIPSGATAPPGGNEGIPSVMIGGAVTTTTALPGIGLTNAYIIPDDVANKLISSTASLLIHQKDSSAKSIVFHGGAANAGTDKYHQSSLSALAHISIGIDDKLTLSSGSKVPTNPTTLQEMIGLEIDTPNRTQNFNSGKAINLSTGNTSNLYYAGENSDFTIDVGTGSNPAGNKYVLTTIGNANSAIYQQGGGFPVNLSQNARLGVIQMQSGLINLVSSANQNIQLYSGGQIKLDTKSGTNPAGTIQLRSASGGIVLDSEDGQITIQQSDASATATGDIYIQNNSTAPNTTVGGDIYITTNSQTILRKTSATALAEPSIVIDYGATTGNVPGGPPNPHTRFVGKQTWAKAGNPTGQQAPTTVSIFKNPAGTITGAAQFFEATGTSANTDYAPGGTLAAWMGGPQATSGVEAGMVAIRLGSEGPTNPVGAGYEMYDNSLGIRVSKLDETEEYFNASKNKIAIGTPVVLKRSNASTGGTINNDPNVTANDNTGTPAPLNYGWNTKQDTTGSGSSLGDQGMPTTAQLNVPLITLAFGPGLGYTDPTSTFINNNINYNYKFNFPIGGYPGQQLKLKIYVQSQLFSQSGPALPGQPSGTTTFTNYGTAAVRIPCFRIKSPKNTGSYTSWWGSAGSNQVVNGYEEISVSTNGNDAPEGIGRYKVCDLVWDGQKITMLGREAINPPFGSDGITTEHQQGWSILNLTSVKSLSTQTVAISGADNTPGCFIAGTIISLQNGDYKNIEDVSPGESIVTWNESKGIQEEGIVERVETREVHEVIKLSFDNGESITTTGSHPFYHRGSEGLGLIDAGELQKNDIVMSLDGSDAKIKSVLVISEPHNVYQLIGVSNNHNYYANEILVHNKQGNPSDIRLKENYEVIGTSPSGIPIYEYSYIGKSGRYIGTMAQDLIKLGRADAVTKMANGYYSVNYSLIDVEYKELNLV